MPAVVTDIGAIVGNIFTGLSLDVALSALVAGVTAQVTMLVPIGIGLTFVLAMPRIIKKVVSSFI